LFVPLFFPLFVPRLVFAFLFLPRRQPEPQLLLPIFLLFLSASLWENYSEERNQTNSKSPRHFRGLFMMIKMQEKVILAFTDAFPASSVLFPQKNTDGASSKRN
jgi:hypothetical protein